MDFSSVGVSAARVSLRAARFSERSTASRCGPLACARGCARALAAIGVIGLLVFVPASALAAPPDPIPDPDPWFGPDKALHFTLSSVIAGGGYGLTALADDHIATRIAFGAGLGLVVGAGKELWDLSGHGDPSWKDFTWDVVGTFVGVGIALTIDLATRSPRASVPAAAR